MLQLLNALSQTADLHTDTIIPIERNNPLFNEDTQLFADVTYGFKLPLTPGNQEFIKNAHLVEAAIEQYAQDATLLVDGTPLHTGKLTYKITGNDIDALFRINFGALSEQTKQVKLCQIYTGDAMELPYDTAHMLAVCKNPKDYGYSFFPIYNEAWSESETETEFVINKWDHAAQKFVPSAWCPFFKLKYLLQKVVEFLGFSIDGEYLKDSESDEIFVYTRIMSSTLMNGSFTYLPQDLTLKDFLIRIKERFQISCNFDMITGKVNVVTPSSVLNSFTVQDLSDYVTAIDEIDVPQVTGYSIILKPDEDDELFLDPNAENENTYIPTNRLTIGDKEKPIDMESSTLKVKTFETYSMPATKQRTYYYKNRSESFPLRFLRYRGMKTLAGGLVFPQAEPVELSLDDATWYKFKNESKTVKLKMTIPAFLLARIKIYQKISFFSKEGNYTIALIEKLPYNLSSGNSSYINATLQCRTMVNSYATDAQLIEYKPDPNETDADKTGLIPATYKAFFDKTRLPAVNIEILWTSRVNGRSVVLKESILLSTDRFGTGGTVIAPPLITPVTWELRVTSGVPRFAIVGGMKFNFQMGNGYYWLNLITLPRSPYDVQGIWIVFEEANLPGPNPISVTPPTDGGGGGVTPPVDPPTEPPVAPTALKEKFDLTVGATLKDGFKDRTPEYKSAYRKHVRRIGGENCFKMHIFQPQEGQFRYAEIDAILAEAVAYDLDIHIHCITWADVNAQFLKDKEGTWTQQQFRDFLINHITTLLTYLLPYVDRITGIDSINEAFGPNGLKSSFWGRVLPDWIDVTVSTVRSIMPNVPQFINDFDFEDSNAKGPTVVNYIKEAATRGIVIDGIGSQSHSSVALNMVDYERRLRVLGNSGLLIHISELDVILKPGSATSPTWATSETWLRDDQGNPIPELDSNGNPKVDSNGNPVYRFKSRTQIELEIFRSSPPRLAAHAMFFTENYRIAQKVIPRANLYGITTWCVGIADSGINFPTFKEFPGLFFVDYTPTPAVQALLDMPVQPYVAP